MTKLSKAKIAAITNRKAFATCAALEGNLSDDAKHFLRCNPVAQDSIMVLRALAYMDDCIADSEDAIAEELEKETDAAYIKGEEAALEMFEVLLDAALYVRIAPDDEANIKDLLSEAAKCEKYRNNIRNN